MTLKTIYNLLIHFSDYYLPEQINIMSGDTCKFPNNKHTTTDITKL